MRRDTGFHPPRLDELWHRVPRKPLSVGVVLLDPSDVALPAADR